MSPDRVQQRQDAAMHKLYKQYGAGRSYANFSRDMNAFFQGLQAAQSSGSADSRERNVNRFLADVNALK